MRLDEGTSFPSAMAIGATGDPKLAYAVGKMIALEARAAGVHWIFAPDADVNNNPDNPIINIRSFGEDPKSVAEFVAQFVRGVEENGALATAKHFPGHGDVSVDSHLVARRRSRRPQANSRSTELVPFRAAIAANVSSIMPGHLAVPALEPDATVPATLSRNILTGLLRDEMKFKGLIVTDAMDMGGVTSLYPPGEAAVRAVEAGADVFFMPPVPDAAMRGLEDAVNSGRISVKRIDESVRRILQAKARARAGQKSLWPTFRALNEKFGLPKFAARRANHRRPRRHFAARFAAPSAARLRPSRCAFCSSRFPPIPTPTRDEPSSPKFAGASTRSKRFAPTRNSSTSRLSNCRLPTSYDVAIAALFVRVADRKGNVGFPDDQRAFVNQILAAGKPRRRSRVRKPLSDRALSRRQNVARRILARTTSRNAPPPARFSGRSPSQGLIPVTVPGTVKRGDGLHVPANPMTLQPAPPAIADRLKPAFALLDRAVSDGAFPGGVLAVGLNDQLVDPSLREISSRRKDAAEVTAKTRFTTSRRSPSPSSPPRP